MKGPLYERLLPLFIEGPASSLSRDAQNRRPCGRWPRATSSAITAVALSLFFFHVEVMVVVVGTEKMSSSSVSTERRDNHVVIGGVAVVVSATPWSAIKSVSTLTFARFRTTFSS